jgi:hypothetical protein
MQTITCEVIFLEIFFSFFSLELRDILNSRNYKLDYQPNQINYFEFDDALKSSN